MGQEDSPGRWIGAGALEGEGSPRLLDIFYSSGVFGDLGGKTAAAIEDVVAGLRPQDRLTVAASIRQIVRRHSEVALRQAEDRMQLAQEVGQIGCFEIDMRDGTSVGTPAFFELYGLPGDRGAWSQQEWLTFIHPDDRGEVVAHIKQVALGAETTTIEYRIVRADGEVRWTTSRARIETATDGRQTRAYGIQQDITERKLAELAAIESDEHHRHFIEVNPAAFWTADLSGRIRVANSSAARQFGVSMEATSVVAGPPLVHSDDWARVLDAWRHALDTGSPYEIEHRMRSADGEYRWVHTRAYARLGEAGAIIGWYGATEDIHERKLVEQRLSWTAAHDSLTGLANRLEFRNQLQIEIDACTGERPVALLLLDLDGFKRVNDRLGHDVGDELLVEMAQRLRVAVGSRGLVSRLGGDEFTILMPHLESEERLAQFADEIASALSAPFILCGRSISVPASIGLAVCPIDAVSISDLLKTADLALYAAKLGARGRWVRFDAEMRR